ncbi:MAG: M28 family peptidase [Candidatus Eisenbacteria bacterium]|nr:M28 family peptidase [Candidatus Eisenbacteria bacterium]
MAAWTLATAVALGPGGCVRAPREAPDGARLLALVERQVAFGPRVPGSAAHDSCRAWIASRLREAGARAVFEQSFVDSVPGFGTVRLTNLVASFWSGGTAGERPRLLFVAHWDSRPWCDRDPDLAQRARPLPGANDGGSGVAVLLELARSFGRVPPAQPVDLVFVDGEDLGTQASPGGFFRGSTRFAADVKARAGSGSGVRYRLGVLLDLVGGRGATFPREPNSMLRAPDAVREVWDAAASLRLAQFSGEIGTSVLDDHIPLNDAGIPTVDVIDFSYPEWHTSRDLPAAMEPAGMVACFRLLAHLADRR